VSDRRLPATACWHPAQEPAQKSLLLCGLQCDQHPGVHIAHRDPYSSESRPLIPLIHCLPLPTSPPPSRPPDPPAAPLTCCLSSTPSETGTRAATLRPCTPTTTRAWRRPPAATGAFSWWGTAWARRRRCCFRGWRRRCWRSARRWVLLRLVWLWGWPEAGRGGVGWWGGVP